MTVDLPFESSFNAPKNLGLLTISIEEICLGVHLDWSEEPLLLKSVETMNDSQEESSLLLELSQPLVAENSEA